MAGDNDDWTCRVCGFTLPNLRDKKRHRQKDIQDRQKMTIQFKKYIDYGKYYKGLSEKQRDYCCNGMGPEWMWEEVRETLDKCFEEFEEAVKTHDVDYVFTDKTTADKRFLYNCRVSAWKEIPWYRPLKYMRFMGYAKILYLFVHLGGDAAYEQAQKQRPKVLEIG